MTGWRMRANAVDLELRHWLQGDLSLDADLEFIYFADLSLPHSPASTKAVGDGDYGTQSTGIVPVAEEIAGAVVLTQTCDIVRSCLHRLFFEVSPLVELDGETLEQVRRLKRPAFAYVPATAHNGLVADLDRVMTVEKAVVANWKRTPGWSTDAEVREFARVIARKRSRFAFPDEFVLRIASGVTLWTSTAVGVRKAAT